MTITDPNSVSLLEFAVSGSEGSIEVAVALLRDVCSRTKQTACSATRMEGVTSLRRRRRRCV